MVKHKPPNLFSALKNEDKKLLRQGKTYLEVFSFGSFSRKHNHANNQQFLFLSIIHTLLGRFISKSLAQLLPIFSFLNKQQLTPDTINQLGTKACQSYAKSGESGSSKCSSFLIDPSISAANESWGKQAQRETNTTVLIGCHSRKYLHNRITKKENKEGFKRLLKG